MKNLFTAILLSLSITTFAQMHPVGIFDDHTDIGHPKLAGNTTYDPATQTYTMKGGGYNIWFDRDEFQYAYKKIEGNFLLTANFEFVGEKGNEHRKIGWMVRQSTSDKAIHYSAVKHGDGLTVLQWRLMPGTSMRDPQDEIFAVKSGFNILQLERSGNTLIMRAAHDGEPLQVIGSTEMTYMPDSVLVGLFICSHDSTKTEEAHIWNVRIDKPVSDDYDMYKRGNPELGCRLETIDVFTGKRMVIHEADHRFEAPNWMPDGKHLIFNERGSLYIIPSDGGDVTKLNTGSLNQLNNDHVIAFDGKKLGISSSSPGTQSRVYWLPLTGGEPTLLTPQSPSYLHGWSGDSREVYYVAQRDTAIYNVYKMDITTKKEVQLTFNKCCHVDGPEGSPDGKWIYFNGTMSGTMQLWRMKPDGSGKEQLTFDEYNNWFPHISPDGKWMAFISFGTDVEPTNHPGYKRCMLRLMPTAGGAPRTIAYLYGGQGTINTPSWSPDSRHIAFVSNSQIP